MQRVLLLSFGVLISCGPALPWMPQGESSSEGGAAPTSGGSTGATAGTTTGIGGLASSDGSTTQASSGESSSGESSGGVTFIVPTDHATAEECDNFAQDCPPGQKCAAYAANGGSSWDSLKCVPVMENPAKVGEACFVVGNGVSGIDNCEFGAYCWDTDAENMGICVALCTGTPEAPMCPPGFTCAISGEAILNLCLNGCDPLIQDCAMDDDVCIATPEGDVLCVLDASGEEGQVHDPCEYLNSCDKGLACVDSAAAVECDQAMETCCEPYCDLTLPNECPGVGQECVPFFPEGMAPPDNVNLGYCSVPG